MAELIVFLLFIVAMTVIEIWYVRHTHTSISAHVQGLFLAFPAIGFLVGFVFGWLGCHFFSGPL